MLQVSLILGTLALILANAFFVASEFAMVKIRPTRLEQLVKEGNVRARLALRISQRLDAYLSANQLGITLASLALGWMGEPAIADLVEPLFSFFGEGARVSAHGVALVIAFFVITSLHTIIGELAPKSLAIQKTEQIALYTAVPLHAFYLLMWPVIWLLNGSANAFVRLFGLAPAREQETTHTSEELRLLLTQKPAGFDAELRRMLVRIFDLRRRTARHVMTLRSDVVTLGSDLSIAQANVVAAEAGYSRYLVLDASSSMVIGYVHLRDLFNVVVGRRRARQVAELLRQPLFARENTSVERLRRDMQARQTPLSVITAPTGEFVGVVTMEDLLEEIVGEIRDENDDELPPIQRRGAGVLEVDGRILLADLERETGIVFVPPVREVETVGGYVLARLRRAPSPEEHVDTEGYTIVPIDVVGRRVRRVRLVPVPQSDHPPPGDEGGK
ncbi:MAG: hemolysin family protein [Polyangiaceae bacterium]